MKAYLSGWESLLRIVARRRFVIATCAASGR